MTKRIRVGLAGGGPWARDVHAPALAAHRDFELTAVWTRRPEAAAAIAAQHGARAVDDIDALVGAVDAVAVAVPPDVQAELAGRAAGAGRHVILEKPIAASLADAEALGAAVDGAGVASIIALVLRYAPETRRWLDTITAGGPWGAGTARWLSGALLGGRFAASPWRQQHGALLDIGPHVFDLLDAALGPIAEVCSATRSATDVWHVVCAHDSGAISTATMSMRLPIDPSLVELDVYGPGGRAVLGPRTTPALQCYSTMLDELATMIRTGSTAHPCAVGRGIHLQSIIERARHLAARSDSPDPSVSY